MSYNKNVFRKTKLREWLLFNDKLINNSVKYLTGVEPALEGQAAILYIKWEVVDIESASCDNLDGLVVAHNSIICDINVRNVWRLPHVYAAGHRQK